MVYKSDGFSPSLLSIVHFLPPFVTLAQPTLVHSNDHRILNGMDWTDTDTYAHIYPSCVALAGKQQTNNNNNGYDKLNSIKVHTLYLYIKAIHEKKNVESVFVCCCLEV